MCGDAGGAVAGVLGVFYQQTPVLSELEAPHAPHELCAARAGVSRPSHSLLQPSTSHPAPPYLFPENMGPKITWRQSHTVSDEVPDRHRPAAALQPPPGPARPPRRPAQPRHRTIPRPGPPLPVPRSPGTRHPLAADPAPPIPAPPAPSGPAPTGTWICPRGRLGEPGCTPGTVRQLMAAQLFTDRPTDRPTDRLTARARAAGPANPRQPRAHGSPPPANPSRVIPAAPTNPGAGGRILISRRASAERAAFPACSARGSGVIASSAGSEASARPRCPA